MSLKRNLPSKTPEKLSSLFDDDSSNNNSRTQSPLIKLNPLKSPMKYIQTPKIQQTPFFEKFTPRINLNYNKIYKNLFFGKILSSIFFFLFNLLLCVIFASLIVVRLSYIYIKPKNCKPELMNLIELHLNETKNINEIINKINETKEIIIETINCLDKYEVFEDEIILKVKDQIEILFLGIPFLIFTILVFISLYHQK